MAGKRTGKEVSINFTSFLDKICQQRVLFNIVAIIILEIRYKTNINGNNVILNIGRYYYIQ